MNITNRTAHDYAQGSAEWLALRVKHFTASEAAAMLGVSKYQTRSELLRAKATGIAAEVDPATQRRFDDGHAAEAAARLIVEGIIKDELYPVTMTADVDGLPLLASMDGLTMLGETGWESKLLNQDLREAVLNGVLDEHYTVQMEQQLMVSGADRIYFTTTDGTLENTFGLWYESNPALRARIVAGWKQFAADLAAYAHEPAQEPAPVGRAPDALPALRIEVTGMVTASNLAAFREHALAVLGGIKTDLQTDADFANAESTVKWCKDVEDRLDAAKQHALSQTASIDELFRTIDAIKAEARTKRLELDKLVKSEKEARKLQIVTQAHQALVAHVQALNQRITPAAIPSAMYGQPMFGEAIKGLKSLDSMRDKVSVALANAKIETSALADRIEANRKTAGDMSLVPDFAAVCTKAPEDFGALYALRKQQREEAEAKRIEAEREKIRAEELSKAMREAAEVARREIEAKAQAHAAEMEAERQRIATIQDYLEAIREYLPEAASICKTSQEVRRSIEDLAERAITPDRYREFYDQALRLKADTLAAMERVFGERAAQEAEVARREAADRAAEASRIVPSATVRIDEASAAGSVTPELAGELRKTVADMASEIAIEHASTKAAESGATVTLGQINARLAPIQLSAAGLAQLGIQPAGRERSAVLFRESDIGRISAALIRHLQGVVRDQQAAA